MLETQSRPKFSNPKLTADGLTRAHVDLNQLETLWINTGTQCNLECKNCYIESSPSNDALAFFSAQDCTTLLKQIDTTVTREIGLTGGEPFLNPDIESIIQQCLATGVQVLLLTNAVRLIQRKKSWLLDISPELKKNLKIRVSLDHYTEETHELERGAKTFQACLKNVKWLADNGFSWSIAGRSIANETEEQAIQGYLQVFQNLEVPFDESQLVIFAEMDPKNEVPEISTSCWDILNKQPDQMMCANSRMVVKRRGNTDLSVLACTLLAYDKQFEMGTDLQSSKKRVYLNHPSCAQFCVLGGSSCS